jgi:hypothetical protein
LLLLLLLLLPMAAGNVFGFVVQLWIWRRCTAGM